MMKFVRAVSAGLAMLMLATAAPAMEGGRHKDQAFGEACGHYANRARFKPRTGQVEFVTVLAEACLAGMRSLASENARERQSARLMLERLVHLHTTIVSMNVERVFGRRAAPEAGLPSVLAPMPGVSATGEYLIAHRMGVIGAIDEWLDSGAEFSLASR